MLHYQTVDPQTLELLKKLQNIPEFSELRLVGGTSLALQIGHRKSIDIDLFGKLDFETYNILPELNKIGKVTILKASKNINIFIIDNIKVDIVNYPYQWLEQSIFENKICLAQKKDIAAMKLAAISGRGTKKDFIDLFFLLKEYTLNEMLGFYNSKYPDGSEFMILKSLTYFEDADQNEMPVMLSNSNWEEIKKSIIENLNNYFA